MPDDLARLEAHSLLGMTAMDMGAVEARALLGLGCPECGMALTPQLFGDFVACANRACDFSRSAEKQAIIEGNLSWL